MGISEDEFAEILKRPGVRGYEPGSKRNVQHRGAQGAKTANADRNAVAPADMEPDIGNESLGAQEVTGPDSCCDIHVHSVRQRLADVDNISAKACIDGLVQANVLFDDTPQEVRQVTYSQEKCKKGQEKTIITLTW